MSGANVGDVVASHNVMTAPSGALVIVYGPKKGTHRGPFTFTDNVFRTTGAVSDEDATGAFLFVNVNGVTIRGNRLTVPSGGTGRGRTAEDRRRRGLGQPVRRDDPDAAERHPDPDNEAEGP